MPSLSVVGSAVFGLIICAAIAVSFNSSTYAAYFGPSVVLGAAYLGSVANRTQKLAVTVLSACLLAFLLILAVHAGQTAPFDASVIALFSVMALLWCAFLPLRAKGYYGLDHYTEQTILRSLLETSCVVLISSKGTIKRASNGAVALFGIPKDQMLGKNFSTLVPGFDYKKHVLDTQIAGQVAAPNNDCWRTTGDEKTSKPVEIWHDITAEGALLCMTDLTHHHEAHAKARELHSQLNKVWRLNSLGEMAATLAHELNQPLGAAASYLHAAQEDMKRAGPFGESALATTELAKAQMLRAGQIIRRMRELLNMEMEALASEKVRRVVEDVLPILTLTGKEKNVQISIDINSPDSVRMDRIQFQQALVNLVRNAVEASPSDTKVLITGRVLSERVYELAVEDSGPGIAPDQVEMIFQPLTTTKSGGMGLGLSVTRTIVESHGGHLRVGTSRWGGARFSFNLTSTSQGADE